jgi:4-amino-4-deoxy-L-arabinose transferase-like glycosyltransferase
VVTTAVLMMPTADASTAAARTGLTNTRVVLALVAILLVGATLRAYLFEGYAGLDDGEYARFAYHLARSGHYPADYTGPAVFPLRVGTILPAAAVYSLAGMSEWSTVVFPFLISLLEIVLIFVFASITFGRGTGLLAAALLAVFFWDIQSATVLLPDLPAAFFSACGITVLTAVHVGPARGGTASLLSGALAGLCFGLSWLCKESITYLVPFCAIWVVVSLRQNFHSRAWLWSGVALGAGAVLLTEAVWYAAMTGDPLFRLHETERNYRQWSNGFFNEGSKTGWHAGTTYRDAVLDRLFVSGPKAILFEPTLYYVPALAVAATLAAFIRRDRAFYIPGLWFATFAFMFNFGSSSLSSYQPLTLFTRYMYPMFFPAIVVVAGVLSRLWCADGLAQPWAPRLRTRTIGAAAAGVIGLGALPTLYYQLRYPPSHWWAAEVRALHAQVEPRVAIYADALTLRAFEFFHHFPADTAWIEFDDMRSEAVPPGSWVIVNDRYIEWLQRNAGMWVAWPHPGPMNDTYPRRSFYTAPPPDWKLVMQTENARVYRVPADMAATQ